MVKTPHTKTLASVIMSDHLLSKAESFYEVLYTVIIILQIIDLNNTKSIIFQ